MANIIDQIIQIDSIAQKKLDDAARLKEQYEKEAKQKIAETNTLIEEKARAKVERIREEEKEQAELEKESLRRQQLETIARLEKIYNDSHEKLEDTIYNNVLG